jgi:hypothetical protein
MKKIPKWAIVFALGIIIMVLGLSAIFILMALELMTQIILIICTTSILFGAILTGAGIGYWRD